MSQWLTRQLNFALMHHLEAFGIDRGGKRSLENFDFYLRSGAMYERTTRTGEIQTSLRGNGKKVIRASSDANSCVSLIMQRRNLHCKISTMLVQGNALRPRVSALPMNFFGPFCDTLCFLVLSDCELTGMLPQSLWKCRMLEVLNFARNSSLTGFLPASIGEDCPRLRDISFSLCAKFSGEIPASVGMLKNLCSLDLGGTLVSGKIPEELGKCANLQFMRLSGCRSLSGGVPIELGKCASLEYLLLDNCSKLKGEVGASLPRSLKFFCVEGSSLEVKGLSGKFRSKLLKMVISFYLAPLCLFWKRLSQKSSSMSFYSCSEIFETRCQGIPLTSGTKQFRVEFEH